MTQPNERLPGRPIARTSDLGEALDAVSAVFLPHELQVLDLSAPLDMQLNAVQMGTVTAGYLRYGPYVHMRTTDASNYHVNIALTGVTESRCGHRDKVAATSSDRAAIFMPGSPADIHWGAGSAQLCLMLARQAVDRELERLLGRELRKPLEFTVAMDITSADAAGWLSTLDVLERETARPHGVTSFPLAAAHLESLIIDGLLLTQPHNYSDALTTATSAPCSRAVRRAADLLNDQPDLPWSTAKLAGTVAVSARTLQEGFARSFGIPPMTYLRNVRLDRVHAELLDSTSTTNTISAIAARWGFLHAGRFAAAYKRRFGCSPSRTRRGTITI